MLLMSAHEARGNSKRLKWCTARSRRWGSTSARYAPSASTSAAASTSSSRHSLARFQTTLLNPESRATA
jgi:hypothetical protein